MVDVRAIRDDFPILKRTIHGKPPVYLDNAATSQKPKQVIQAMVDYYEQHNANVHRGIHTLGDESTRLYSEARRVVATFIGAKDPNELIFVRNTTEGINLVARAWGEANLTRGDVVLVTQMEHHSNIVPWQMVAKRVGVEIDYVRVNLETGELDLDDLRRKLTKNVKLVALVQVSNFLGTINPIREIVQEVGRQNSRQRGGQAEIRILVDGAQAVPHLPVDVEELGVDFYAFSGHKMLGPMGIGGLWVKRELLEKMEPFLVGGGMIDEVTWEGTTFTNLPDRFDAGTPNVAGAVGLAAAVKYLQSLGMNEVRDHEMELTSYMLEGIKKLESRIKVEIFGPRDVEKRGGVVSFVVDGIHAHDVAQVLDREFGVAVRSGHHCTMPTHRALKVAATTRASFYIYNTREDIDVLIEGLEKVGKIFGK